MYMYAYMYRYSHVHVVLIAPDLQSSALHAQKNVVQ